MYMQISKNSTLANIIAFDNMQSVHHQPQPPGPTPHAHISTWSAFADLGPLNRTEMWMCKIFKVKTSEMPKLVW